jgi:hypothetical protein
MLFSKKVKCPTNLKFGKWNDKLDILDKEYDNLYIRFVHFASQICLDDPYNRDFNLEPLIDFAIISGLYNQNIDYIYRHYVYNQLSMIEYINIEEEEKNRLIEEFIVI